MNKFDNLRTCIKSSWDLAPKDLKLSVESAITALGLETLALITGWHGLLIVPALVLTNIFPYVNRLRKGERFVKK